ncbi:MAG TPA: DbpA RNA binding domain-containing protein, partial [Kofleriaceae bacterium]
PPPSERPRREARPQPARPDREPREHPKLCEHRPAREPREQTVEGSAWFTINIGRSKNADPKWLIPLLCRRGNIAKSEIGKIQILMRETRVEIRGDASAQFARSVRKPDDRDRNIHIEPLDA